MRRAPRATKGISPAEVAATLEALTARERRAVAIRFLRSTQTMGELLQACASEDKAAEAEARKLAACVVLMVRQDAPEDLAMTDAALYRRLRARITELRMAGWRRR